jgi:hypothetical protein
MSKPIEPDILVGVVFILIVILGGIWSTIFSLTSARRLYKKLKEAGDEPKVNLNVFSMIQISVILCVSAKRYRVKQYYQTLKQATSIAGYVQYVIDIPIETYFRILDGYFNNWLKRTQSNEVY